MLTSFRPVFYLAAPYSHPDPAVRETRFCHVNEAAARLTKVGYGIISPLSMGVTICRHGGDIGTDWKTWRDVCLRLIERCDALCLLMLPGWRESTGVLEELQYAESLGLPVHCIGMDGDAELIPNVRWRELP